MREARIRVREALSLRWKMCSAERRRAALMIFATYREPKLLIATAVVLVGGVFLAVGARRDGEDIFLGSMLAAAVLFISFFVTATETQAAHFVSARHEISVFWPKERGAMDGFMQCKAYEAVWKVQQARMKLLARKSE